MRHRRVNGEHAGERHPDGLKHGLPGLRHRLSLVHFAQASLANAYLLDGLKWVSAGVLPKASSMTPARTAKEESAVAVTSSAAE